MGSEKKVTAVCPDCVRVWRVSLGVAKSARCICRSGAKPDLWGQKFSIRRRGRRVEVIFAAKTVARVEKVYQLT